jgi:catechol 2,3-dioxygenase-like lactoylglutathione lyase family enzyme
MAAQQTGVGHIYQQISFEALIYRTGLLSNFNDNIPNMNFHTTVPILYSNDVLKSLEYYTEVLGFDCKWDWGNPPSFGGVSKDGVQIYFCEKEQGNPGTWLSIMLDNVDEYYEKIKAKGANIVSPPESMSWGIREMLVQDPDGHCIRFGHNISHRPAGSSPLPEAVRIVERKPTIEEYKELVSAVGWTQTQANADWPSITGDRREMITKRSFFISWNAVLHYW